MLFSLANKSLDMVEDLPEDGWSNCTGGWIMEYTDFEEAYRDKHDNFQQNSVRKEIEKAIQNTKKARKPETQKHIGAAPLGTLPE